MRQSTNYIPPEILEEIRTRSDIVEVISELGVLLKPAGKHYKGLCPFHDEKTPSFTVSREKQYFHCFGCSVGGDVIGFIRKHEGKSFIETVTWLAERAGVSLPTADAQTRQASRKRLELQDLNQFAVDYFHQSLLNPKIGGHALAYLKKRGITDKTIQHFKLGHATPGRRDVVKAATQEGFSIQQLVDVGLIKNEEQGPLDRFRERVMFPIRDERGNPVGFGGRALSDDQLPKYLNSPTTALYDKSKTLYNLYDARLAIQKEGHVILVEGYFDALMLYQKGIENVVASLGTAFSEFHATLLKRFTEETVIVYDGDAAGLQATLRGLHTLLKAGLKVRIAVLPPEDDPDQFVRTQGVDAFKQLIASAMNMIEFQIQRLTQHQAIHRVDTKAQIVEEIALTLANLQSPISLNEYVKYAIKELDVEKAVMWKALKSLGVKATPPPTYTSQKPGNHQVERLTPRERVERQLIETLIWNPDLISSARANFHYQDFSHPDLIDVARLLWEAEEITCVADIKQLVNTCDNENLSSLVSKALLQTEPPPNPQARVDGCLKKLKEFLLKDIERLRRSALTAENNKTILAELIELSNRRRQLSH